MKKNKVIGLFAALGCVAVAAGAGAVSPKTVSATATVGGVDVSSFVMTYGASVRFGAKDGKNGIRFQATLDETKYAELEALEANTEKTVAVNYGMLIVPADMTAVVADPTVAFGTDYTLEADCNPDGDECTCGKTHIASVQYTTLNDTVAGDGVVNLLGSLVDIKDSNLTREFVGVGYIEYVVDGAATYEIAPWALDEAQTEGSSNVANNTRSMTYVAQLAIAAKQDDANKTLQKTYVDSLDAYEFKYTVKHYIPASASWTSANDFQRIESYELAKTEEVYGTLGATVSAKNSAKEKGSDLGCADFVKFVFDDDKSKTGMFEDTLYANGKTVVEAYYTVEGNTEITSYNLTNRLNEASSEKVTESGRECVQVTDNAAAGSRNAQGIFMGLKFSEAWAIQQILWDESTIFTWKVTVKAVTPTNSKGDSIAHAKPYFNVGGAKSDSVESSVVHGSEGDAEIDATTYTTKFKYDDWLTIKYAETDAAGTNFSGTWLAKPSNTTRYLTGVLHMLRVGNAFNTTKTTGEETVTVYIQEISWSIAAAA